MVALVAEILVVIMVVVVDVMDEVTMEVPKGWSKCWCHDGIDGVNKKIIQKQNLTINGCFFS